MLLGDGCRLVKGTLVPRSSVKNGRREDLGPERELGGKLPRERQFEHHRGVHLVSMLSGD